MSPVLRWLSVCSLSVALASASGCARPVGIDPDASDELLDAGADQADGSGPFGPLDASEPVIPPDASEPYVSPDAAYVPDVGVPALKITSASKIHGTLEKPIELALTAEGGTPPYYCSLSPASLLPVGFSFSSDGVLRGTPHSSGHFPFGVTVTDVVGRQASATLEIYVADPILNDLCIVAAPLDLSSGAATVLATLDGATANGVAESCQLSSALPDVFYSFVLDATSKVSIVATSAAAAIFAEDCSGAVAPLACGATLSEMLAPGAYTIGVAGGASDFRLDVKATPLLGDSCADIIPLDLSNGQVTVAGTFKDAKADLSASCNYTGPDRVYTFELASDADVRVSSPGGYLAKAVRSGACPGKAELACSDGFSDLFLLNVKAGQYILVLRPAYGLDGDFTFTVTTSGPTLPPANDTCANATKLTLVNDTAQMTGTLLGATYDPLTSNCSNTRPDVFYELDLASPSTLVIDEGYGSETSVQLLSGTCGQLVSQGCGDSYWDPYCKDGLPAGKYFLRVVSSYAYPQQAQPFTYTVTRKNPALAPANDTCSAPAALTFKSGSATAAGTLVGAGADYSLPCTSSSSTKRHDLLYSFALTSRSDVELSATSADNTDLNLGLISTDCETGEVIACTADTSYRPLQLWGLEPGDYWVLVEGYEAYNSNTCWEGKFTINAKASASPPAPANDSCTAPTAYTFDGPGSAALITGTTRGAADDFGKVSCNSLLLDGPDVVYAITLGAAARLRITATNPVESLYFYLTASCGSTSTIACTQGYSTKEILTNSLPAGTYYLVVDNGSSYGRTSALDFILVLDTL